MIAEAYWGGYMTPTIFLITDEFQLLALERETLTSITP